MASKVHKTQLWPFGKTWYWHAKGRNGKVMFTAGESLSRKGRVIELLQNEWPHAPIEVLDADGRVVETIEATEPT